MNKRKPLVLALLAMLSACAPTAEAPLYPAVPANAAFLRDPGHGVSSKIKHIVWIMQENRSFDDLFQGFPGADTQSYGLDSHGNTISLAPISLAAGYDIDHTSGAHFLACNGTGSLPGTNCQ